MRNLAIALAASLSFAVPANAGVVLFDNFDGEASGQTVTDYNGFANFDVVGGTVDLLRQPNQFGLTCAGGAGSSCVDLDGSTGDGGRLITKNAFTFNAGDIIKLTLDISGSQRGDTNNWGLGFATGGGAISFIDFYGGGPLFGTSSAVSGVSTSATVSSIISSGAPYSQIFATFRAGNDLPPPSGPVCLLVDYARRRHIRMEV